uniref:Uncharacterized protein n=1 Tax=Sphaerodactylus townsendi TaxID=933632 RepID=A0ACB8FL49_9SAUR
MQLKALEEILSFLEGIECPRGARNLPGLVQEGEPFSEEATLFTKELVLQREVGPSGSLGGPRSPTWPCLGSGTVGGGEKLRASCFKQKAGFVWVLVAPAFVKSR